MPFKSEAQREKFKTLVKEGKLSKEKYNEWEKATGDTKLPERVKETKSAPRESKIKNMKVIK